MSVIESLNSKYTNLVKVIDTLKLYYNKISTEIDDAENSINKVSKSIEYLEKLSKNIDCNEYIEIIDTINLGKQYVKCLKSIEEYKSALILMKSDKDVLKTLDQVVAEQKEYDKRKTAIEKDYNYRADSEDALNKIILACIDDTVNLAEKQTDKLKLEAKSYLDKEKGFSIELRKTDILKQIDSLPDKMPIARCLIKKDMPIFADTDIEGIFSNVFVDLKNSGNVLVKCPYKQMEDSDLDAFILAYIFRYIEEFPLGSVNIHIFGKNINHLYTMLNNGFHSEKSSETTKKIVQIHTDINELNIFNNVICEDIMKKISFENPDLYSIYENDKTDSFNLVILRSGLIGGDGYASQDVLEMVNHLTKINESGHKCGLRFLIIDNSSSFDKELSLNAKSQINKISENCNVILDFIDKSYILNGKNVEILHIGGNIEEFVQERTRVLASAIDSKEQNYISVDEVFGEREEHADAIIYIPVGKSGNNVIRLPFSCKDEHGTVEGQCVGYMVIGQSGSGKSSFFHSLVINGCVRYLPEDLQFWLLDFKNGGASSKYSQSGLPHIRIIAENNKIDDALCLFQMVLEEMERRSKAFNKNGVDNIIDYNRIVTERGEEYFPRVIIVIDEVQEIFRGDDASIFKGLISSISSRMRSSGMHFVMFAQNLSDAYMLKEAFLPHVTGRICFRVAPEIPSDSGFGEDFVQRKKEIAELKTGEAYIEYGKNTIKKVKMAYISPQEMSDYFENIKEQYPKHANMKPLVIGQKKRLTICSSLQGRQGTYYNELKSQDGVCSAVIGEDVYRMSPLKVKFSQNENSAVLLLGNDKQISSSICTSIVLSLLKQNITMHLFNGDKSEIQEEDRLMPHSFMFVCKNIKSKLVHNHKLSELKNVVKDIYLEYLNRRSVAQEADDVNPKFEPIFMVINDLFAIESILKNEIIEEKFSDDVKNNENYDYDIFREQNYSENEMGERVQKVISTFIEEGWRYNIHMIIGIKSLPSEGSGILNAVSKVQSVLLFNTTEFAEQFENQRYINEMLKNISNDSEAETMAVWRNNKTVSKIRPIIYNLSESKELQAIESLLSES